MLKIFTTGKYVLRLDQFHYGGEQCGQAALSSGTYSAAGPDLLISTTAAGLDLSRSSLTKHIVSYSYLLIIDVFLTLEASDYLLLRLLDLARTQRDTKLSTHTN